MGGQGIMKIFKHKNYYFPIGTKVKRKYRRWDYGTVVGYQPCSTLNHCLIYRGGNCKTGGEEILLEYDRGDRDPRCVTYQRGEKYSISFVKREE